jgi:phosphoribosylformimino-5-aminoimidazole carboxamide ribotide isomerase
LRIIPVMDILDGVVVHAVKGERSQYLPLQSLLCSSSKPDVIASEFRKCGFDELYIADLDAIQGKGNNLGVVQQIAEETGFKLMVDAGISNVSPAEKLFRYGVNKVIIGTETLSSLNFIEQAVEKFGGERIVVSLDLKAGVVLSKSTQLMEMSAGEIVRRLEGLGVAEFIVLDLAKVGSDEGVDFPFLKNLVSASKGMILVGGGVRGIDDLVALKNLGIQGTLVATALHTRNVSLGELRKADMLAFKPVSEN